jgi:flagellar biosynthesis protein FlhG
MTALADQAARLRALVERADPAPCPPAAPPARSAHVIAIASGKGGVGKTCLAVNLSLALAAGGLETVLIDGDTGLGNADLLLGVPAGPHLGAVVRGTRTLDDVAVRVAPRLRLIAAGSGIASLADLDASARSRLIDAFATIERSARVILIDCGAGLGPVVLDLVASADTVLVVATPEPTAIADAYGLIKTLAIREPRPSSGTVRLVVNQAADRAEAARIHARMSAVSERFLGLSIPLSGWVGRDPHVAQAVCARRPFILSAPRSTAGKHVRDLCGSVRERIDREAPRSVEASGLLTRWWRRTTAPV